MLNTALGWVPALRCIVKNAASHPGHDAFSKCPHSTRCGVFFCRNRMDNRPSHVFIKSRTPMTDRRPLLRAIFDAAVAAAHPDVVLSAHLRPVPKGRVIFLAAGKGAAAMAAAALPAPTTTHRPAGGRGRCAATTLAGSALATAASNRRVSTWRDRASSQTGALRDMTVTGDSLRGAGRTPVATRSAASSSAWESISVRRGRRPGADPAERSQGDVVRRRWRRRSPRSSVSPRSAGCRRGI